MTEPQPPMTTYIATLNVAIDTPLDLGATAQGRRRFIPVVGGRVAGPYLNGEVWPGGGDWQTVRDDGVIDLHAHYALALNDGTPVEFDNTGYRYRADNTAQTGYYFQTSARLTVASGEHEWLNRTVFIAPAERHANEVVVELFALGPFVYD